MPIRRQSCALCFSVALLPAAALPALADPEAAPPVRTEGGQQQLASDAAATDESGEDFTRPENCFDLRFEDKSSGTATRTNNDIVLPRIEGRLTLNSDWKAGWLAQLPLVEKTTATLDPAGSSYEFGIGDAAFQGTLSHDIDALGIRLRRPACYSHRGGRVGERQVADHARLRRALFLPRIWVGHLFRPEAPLCGELCRRPHPTAAPTTWTNVPGADLFIGKNGAVLSERAKRIAADPGLDVPRSPLPTIHGISVYKTGVTEQ